MSGIVDAVAVSSKADGCERMCTLVRSRESTEQSPNRRQESVSKRELSCSGHGSCQLSSDLYEIPAVITSDKPRRSPSL